MEAGSLRIFLAGRVAVQASDVALDESALAGRQARLLLAFLVLERYAPATREQLANLLWGEALPREWQSGLNALASKLRQALAALPATGLALDGGHGWYQLRVPPRAWVDVEHAFLAVDRAAASLAAGDHATAWGEALVAATIARRPLLSGVDNPWADERRAALRGVLVRSLETFAEACRRGRQPALAVSSAEEAVTLEPFRESAYRCLMRAHAAAGNRAEALQVYERCRRLLDEHLGTAPSRRTRALHETLLHD